MRVLMSLPWKGNIRELDNILERAMILGNGEWITASDLPGQKEPEDGTGDADRLCKALELCERNHIERTLGETNGDKARAAELSGTEPFHALPQNRKARHPSVSI